MTVPILAVALALSAIGALVLLYDRWSAARVVPDRKVRLHLRGPEGADVTLDGFLVKRVAGHYILRRVTMVVGPDDDVSLTGDVEVPEARVLFVQVLAA